MECHMEKVQTVGNLLDPRDNFTRGESYWEIMALVILRATCVHYQTQRRNCHEQSDLYLQGLIFLKRSSLFTLIVNHASIAANIYR